MKVRGNTVGTANPQPDWNQKDTTKADFIKNKPASLPAYTEADYGKVLSASAAGLTWIDLPTSTPLPSAEEVAF